MASHSAEVKTSETWQWHANLFSALSGGLKKEELKPLRKVIEISYQLPKNVFAESVDFTDIWDVLERRGLLKVGRYDCLLRSYESLKWLDQVKIIKKTSTEIEKLQESQTTKTAEPVNAKPLPDHQTPFAEPVAAEDSALADQPVKSEMAEIPLSDDQRERTVDPITRIEEISNEAHQIALTAEGEPADQMADAEVLANQMADAEVLANQMAMRAEDEVLVYLMAMTADTKLQAHQLSMSPNEPANQVAMTAEAEVSGNDPAKPALAKAKIGCQQIGQTTIDDEPVRKMTQQFQQVRIDGETFSLGAGPAATTKLVRTFSDILTEGLGVPRLVTDLKTLILGLRMAFYSTELKPIVAEVGLTVAKVCQEAGETVLFFKNECVHAVEILKLTHFSLVHSREDIAITHLKKLAGLSKRLWDASKDLTIVLDDAEYTIREIGNQHIQAREDGNGHEQEDSALYAINALLHIGLSLKNASDFWSCMCVACKGPIGGDGSILQMMNNEKEKWISEKWWGSGVFRRNIIEYSAMLVALGDIFLGLERQISKAKVKVWKTMKICPKAEEANEMLPKLMGALNMGLDEVRQTLEEVMTLGRKKKQTMVESDA